MAVAMKMQEQPKGFRSWVEWRAGRIDDPVGRLRYLRTVRPARRRSSGGPGRRICRRRAGAAAGMVVVAIASGLLVRARTRVEALPFHAKPAQAPVLWSEGLPQVWLVEKSRESESYSNG